ncbi:hypothetical protein BS78_07G113600 [Paspalum vaginatum]|nr:hypothetical protein BS78_07G113600 [Paspalum vaginatum]
MAPFSLHLLMVPLPAPLLHPRLLHGRQQQSCWPALPSSARRLLLPAGHPLLSLHLPSLASSLCSLLYMQQQLGQDDTVTLFPRSAAPIPCSSLPAALTHNQQHLLHLFLLYVQQQETAAAALRYASYKARCRARSSFGVHPHEAMVFFGGVITRSLEF